MEEILNEISELIDKSNNIPDEIRSIVKAICRGYIRESNGKIPIEGIINVCNTDFRKIDQTDKAFSGEERILGQTQTDYDDNCNVIHNMSYVNDSNYIKLITILTHELGHVITESKPCEIDDNGIYPFVKKTSGFCLGCLYSKEELLTKGQYGLRMSDGFLESICNKIFESLEFREELLSSGYDLKDYVYKDKRLFPSRVYDEYKACFELFDYIMDGALFDFSCMSFDSNEDLANYINKYKLIAIFGYLDKSNNALWALKGYEGKEWDDNFGKLFQQYVEYKDASLYLSKVCLEKLYNKSVDDPLFQQLFDTYASTLEKQKQLPIPNEYLKNEGRQLS